jgi:hypothetical protein
MPNSLSWQLVGCWFGMGRSSIHHGTFVDKDPIIAKTVGSTHCCLASKKEYHAEIRKPNEAIPESKKTLNQQSHVGGRSES